jgi:hypothetical protein
MPALGNEDAQEAVDGLEVADVGFPHLVRVQPRAETEGEIAGEAAALEQARLFELLHQV